MTKIIKMILNSKWEENAGAPGVWSGPIIPEYKLKEATGFGRITCRLTDKTTG